MNNKPLLEVRLGEYGRGVYCTKDIPSNTIVIVDNLLLIPVLYVDDPHILKRYVFKYSKNLSAVDLGLGSLLNHSNTKSNLTWVVKKHKQLPQIVFSATKDIKAGQELLLDYGYNPEVYLK
jgi:uncharacterized protein